MSEVGDEIYINRLGHNQIYGVVSCSNPCTVLIQFLLWLGGFFNLHPYNL